MPYVPATHSRPVDMAFPPCNSIERSTWQCCIGLDPPDDCCVRSQPREDAQRGVESIGFRAGRTTDDSYAPVGGWVVYRKHVAPLLFSCLEVDGLLCSCIFWCVFLV